MFVFTSAHILSVYFDQDFKFADTSLKSTQLKSSVSYGWLFTELTEFCLFWPIHDDFRWSLAEMMLLIPYILILDKWHTICWYQGGGSLQLYNHDCSARILGHTTRAPQVGSNRRPTASNSMPLPTWTRHPVIQVNFFFRISSWWYTKSGDIPSNRFVVITILIISCLQGCASHNKLQNSIRIYVTVGSGSRTTPCSPARQNGDWLFHKLLAHGSCSCPYCRRDTTPDGPDGLVEPLPAAKLCVRVKSLLGQRIFDWVGAHITCSVLRLWCSGRAGHPCRATRILWLLAVMH